MRLIRTEDAVGQVLCHDMTQIIKDQYKDARFRKGHVVTAEDIPVLLSMGKEHLYVWEMTPDMILCTGGMSVDPDDNTPGGIKAAGADIVCYGAPVLPGAMFLLGYFADGMPVMGLPGCVMYAGATVFDLVLPKVAADVPVTRADIAVLGEGDYTAHVDRVIRDLNGSVVLLRPADSADAPFLRVRVPEEAAIAQGSTVTFGLRPDKCLCYA